MEDPDYAALLAAYDSAVSSTSAMFGSVRPGPARSAEQPDQSPPEATPPPPPDPTPQQPDPRTRSDPPAEDPSDGTYRSDSGPAVNLWAIGAVVAVGGLGVVLLALTGRLFGVLGLVVLVVMVAALAFGLRRNSTRTRVAIENGTMTVVLGERHHTFYLNRESTQLAMTGEPGDRDWRVEVLRKGMAPVVIDGRAVDPPRFTAALRVWRPDL